MQVNPTIRKSVPEDLPAIRLVVESAFGQQHEMQLIEDLLADPSAMPLVSLVAGMDGKVIGHILFSRVTFDPDPGSSELNHAILAPMAVDPFWQKRGVGGALIRTGLDHLRQLRTGLVFVLGHPDYYPRYGFKHDAASYGFTAPYPIPGQHADAWMLQVLDRRALAYAPATVRCADALNKTEYWVE